MSKYTIFYLEVLLFIIVITLLSQSSAILATRHIFLAIIGTYSSWRLIKSSATLASLGIRRTNFLSSIYDLINPSLIIILAVYLVFEFTPIGLLTWLVGYDALPTISFTRRIIAYIFLSAPIQELIFRGYITWRIKEVFSDTRLIQWFSIAFFTLAHIPFKSPLLIIITFFMSILYIRNYQKYQNLFAPIISHALVGAVLIVIRNVWFPYQ